ncbi:MAG: hypothetical protein Q8L87_18660 [Anaerolineales bacterium]|nr:hypothetical protein [Anaerolineales bacterium]
MNFGVDHYRPKGIPRFAHLVCDYANLYYCCGSCNSRKNNDWPVDEKAGPYVVNPCNYEMASHLRFDHSTGRVEPKTPHGRHTEELLQINDDATVQYRLNTLHLVRVMSAEIELLQHQLREIAALLRKGNIPQIQYELDVQSINQEMAKARGIVQAHSGELPLPSLKSQRLGVVLVKR